MAKRFLTAINVLNSASDPVSAAEGDLYYNTLTDKLRIYSNSAWSDVSSGSGGVTSLSGTANQIDVSASTGAVTVSLSNTAVTPATYGSASAVGTVTVDSKGRITGASNTAIAIAQSAVTNLTTDLSAKAPLASPQFTGIPNTTSTTGNLFKFNAGGTSDHGYLTFFIDTDNPSTRSGYYGWPSAASTTLTIANEMTNGNINILTNGTGVVQINGSEIAKLSSPTFTGTVTVPTPVNSTDAATKAYVDSVVINTQTASYQLVLADAGEVIEMNVATANNLTVPLNSSVPFPIGTSIDIVQYGAGQTTIVATGGVTIRSSGNKLKLTGQYSAATLYKRGTDEWVAMGDLSA